MRKLLMISLIPLSNLLFGQITGYDHQVVEGFDVYVEEYALNNHPLEVTAALDLLSVKLEEINGFGLEDQILDSLQAVRFFMDWNTTNGAAVYHPNLQWLIDNGYMIEKWKSVEISNITNFIDWTVLNQPYMIVHELAHAYHDRVLGFDHDPIIQAYNHAMQESLYDWVLYHAGNDVYYYAEAYATTNELEYFAELTEAFLGENDYYPFTKEELMLHDPTGYAVLAGIWLFGNITTTADYVSETPSVYPNPTSGIVNVEWQMMSGVENVELAVHDIYGRRVLWSPVTRHPRPFRTERSGMGSSLQLDLGDLPPGLYYLFINDKQYSKVIKH